ncbi:HAD superfamily hydrolase (TIGR01509 family)/beta-phosphoglucomutase family hydrolase [Mumia flava]|uniref:Beta-phosphoglucomutase n=1 Tax=Mumia flava TaxID=1348852 RepID=A0A2M9BHT3_9ACTN|nr:beta-phosphoglucomutase family hydrolase [Mumia flava]PJJ57501.1 HAD superfamily hydrolase (TIGR01509 family)/beta-phosphoglucomutase family hydrolase [Mumia flava]
MTDSPQPPPAVVHAVLFDLDGVLTPTAEVHMRAWAALFTDYLGRRGLTPDYTDDDYFAYVDGKPRYDGVRSLLASRGVTLPEGDPTDPPTAETVCGLGNRKNAEFATLLATEGVAAYPGSVALLDDLETRGIAMAVVSSSANARDVLAAAGLGDRFGVVVDGLVAREHAIAGKPAPDTYAYGAAQLGVPSRASVVVEDAVSGVQAGAAGDFALVVGVDRGAGADVLRSHGADVVVTDLAELVGVLGVSIARPARGSTDDGTDDRSGGAA